jgi:hypothetical protein
VRYYCAKCDKHVPISETYLSADNDGTRGHTGCWQMVIAEKYTDTPLFKRLLAAEVALGVHIGIDPSVPRGERIRLLAAHAESGGAFDPALHGEWMRAMLANLNYIENKS